MMNGVPLHSSFIIPHSSLDFDHSQLVEDGFDGGLVDCLQLLPRAGQQRQVGQLVDATGDAFAELVKALDGRREGRGTASEKFYWRSVALSLLRNQPFGR